MGKTTPRLLSLVLLGPLVFALVTALSLPILVAMPIIAAAIGALVLFAGMAVLRMGRRRVEPRDSIEDRFFWIGGLLLEAGAGLLMSGIAFMVRSIAGLSL